MAQQLHIDVTTDEQLARVSLNGDVDAMVEEAVNDAVDSVLDQSRQPQVLFDFSGVEYMNSGGLAILIGAVGKIREADGRLAACGLNDHYQKIVTMVGLAEYMPLFADRQEAARFLSKGQ